MLLLCFSRGRCIQKATGSRRVGVAWSHASHRRLINMFVNIQRLSKEIKLLIQSCSRARALLREVVERRDAL